MKEFLLYLALLDHINKILKDFSSANPSLFENFCFLVMEFFSPYHWKWTSLKTPLVGHAWTWDCFQMIKGLIRNSLAPLSLPGLPWITLTFLETKLSLEAILGLRISKLCFHCVFRTKTHCLMPSFNKKLQIKRLFLIFVKKGVLIATHRAPPAELQRSVVNCAGPQ